MKKAKLLPAMVRLLQLSPRHQRMMKRHRLMVHLKMEHQVTTQPCKFSFPSLMELKLLLFQHLGLS